MHIPRPRSPGGAVGLALAGFAALQLVFFALLVAGAAVPDRPIIEHLAADVRAGTYGPNAVPDRMGGASDSSTECVVVGTGLGGTDTNPMTKAAVMPRLSNCAAGGDEILRLERGQPITDVTSYVRYWAGYTPLTRPVLALFGMAGLRVVVGGVLVLALYAAGRSLSRHAGGPAALALLGPLLLSTNLMSTPSTSFSQAISTSAYLLGVAACAWAARRSLGWGLVATAGAAALFCYVDLLTTVAIGWAFSAATVTAVTFLRTRRLGPTLVALLGSGVLWPVAFAATWASRWVLAVPFVGLGPVAEDVKTSVFFRTEGAYPGVRDELGAATASNWDYWLSHVPTAGAVLWAGIVVAALALVLAIRRGRAHVLAAVLVAAPALTVPFWYEALRNHSQIHEFFVYRSVPAALGVVVFAAVVAARAPASAGAPAGGPGDAEHESRVPVGSGASAAAR